MDIQGYHCAGNLRLRAWLVLNEMALWQDWAADEEDTGLIETIEQCLKAMHRKKVAVCIVYEKQTVSGGWEKRHSGNGHAIACSYERDGDGMAGDGQAAAE